MALTRTRAKLNVKLLLSATTFPIVDIDFDIVRYFQCRQVHAFSLCNLLVLVGLLYDYVHSCNHVDYVLMGTNVEEYIAPQCKLVCV